MALSNLSDIYTNVWAPGEHPGDIGGRDAILNQALSDVYGPQYRNDSLGSRWSSWAGADEMGGADEFSGIEPYQGTTQLAGGSRSPAFMGGNTSYGSAGGGSSDSVFLGYKPSDKLADFMKTIEGRQNPVYGEMPTLEFGEFSMPEIDENKVAFLTEQAGAQDRGMLRNEILSKVMSEASSIQNPTQRKNFIREALSGYGTALGQIQKAAGQEGRANYMNMYYNPAVTEASTNYQSSINAKTANFNAAMNRLSNIYNFEGNRALAGDQMLFNYYQKYNLA